MKRIRVTDMVLNVARLLHAQGKARLRGRPRGDVLVECRRCASRFSLCYVGGRCVGWRAVRIC